MKKQTSKKAPKRHSVKADVMRSLPAEDVDSVLRMLSNHAYGKEQYKKCINDLTKIDDAFAFDNAVMIVLLGGELEGKDA